MASLVMAVGEGNAKANRIFLIMDLFSRWKWLQHLRPFTIRDINELQQTQCVYYHLHRPRMALAFGELNHYLDTHLDFVGVRGRVLTGLPPINCCKSQSTVTPLTHRILSTRGGSLYREFTWVI